MSRESARHRDTILREAAKLFARKGYAAASVREIVEKAGVTKPTMYLVFPFPAFVLKVRMMSFVIPSIRNQR